MPSERVQRQIDRLLDEAEAAIAARDWLRVRDSAFDPRDQISCIDSGFDYTTSECAAVRHGYAIDTAAGDYRRFEHAMRIGLRYELQ